MSRQRRNFNAKFKSDLVIELLKGEKDLNTLATENNIQPNLLRNWKKEFLNNVVLCQEKVQIKYNHFFHLLCRIQLAIFIAFCSMFLRYSSSY